MMYIETLVYHSYNCFIQSTSIPWCTTATTASYKLHCYPGVPQLQPCSSQQHTCAAIWARLLAWASQCNTMTSLLVWDIACLRWVVSSSKYLPYVWDRYQKVSLDMRKCCLLSILVLLPSLLPLISLYLPSPNITNILFPKAAFSWHYQKPSWSLNGLCPGKRVERGATARKATVTVKCWIN